MAADTAEHLPSRSGAGVLAAWGLLALALLWWIFAPDRAAPLADPDCEPIGFTLAGDPPPFVDDELELAMSEIHERSGVAFERDVPGDTRRPKLSVSWVAPDALGPTSTAVGAGAGRTRLGFGSARWRTIGEGRDLVGATIEVNRDVDWPRGLETNGGLAAVFVHELGHVLGLSHNADPVSFMHPETSSRTPTWNAEEVAQLARFGAQSGCRPVPSGAPSGAEGGGEHPLGDVRGEVAS